MERKEDVRQNQGGSAIGYLIAGIGVGAILGVLAAPRSGQETREYLRQRVDQGRDRAETAVRQARQRAEEIVKQGGQVIAEQKELIAGAVDAGRETYWREKSKEF